MDDITITNPPFVTPPAVTRAMQAELLKHLAINWPATPTGFPADMVRAALSAGAAMLDGTAPKRKPYDILAEDFGLKLTRLSGDKHVRVIGVRTSGGGAAEHLGGPRRTRGRSGVRPEGRRAGHHDLRREGHQPVSAREDRRPFGPDVAGREEAVHADRTPAAREG